MAAEHPSEVEREESAGVLVPLRPLQLADPFRWLARGARDFARAPAIFAALVVALGLLGSDAIAADSSPKFDLVIRNGRVIDPESGLDGVHDVGVRGGRIAAIAKEQLAGQQVLDATGLIVAPGFIDLHSHGWQLLGARVQAHDGVTTALDLEGGVASVTAFYNRIAEGGWPINYGASASWAHARTAEVRGMPAETPMAGNLTDFGRQGPASQELMRGLRARLERELDEGALGIGILLGYAPRTGREEFVELNRWAAARGVPTFAHLRFVANLEAPDQSFQEALAVAAATGVHLHLCHVNSMAGRFARQILAAIAKAQTQGLRVTVEAYPYGAGSGAIGAAFLQGDSLARQGMKKEDLLRDGKALTAEEFDRLQKVAPRTRVVIPFLNSDTDPNDRAILEASVLFPGGAIASDAAPWTIDHRAPLMFADIWPLPETAFAHPRSAGTFSRFLRVYVRERQAISLPDALAKTSLIPARILEKSVPQMRSKGRIAKGMDADLVVFDMATISDGATYEKPAQISAGIRHVIVGGVPVIENGVLDPSRRPGRPVRRTKRP
jgi:N-acyl-D-glutamate deacylase